VIPASAVIRIQRLPHGAGIELPQYMTDGAAAADIRAAVDLPVALAPGEIAMIPTGLAMEIPAGWEVQIRPRSGLAVKHGVTVINAPATIDADYRGEVKVALVNHGREPFTVERDMRIAQLLVTRVTRIAWEEAEELTPTARGAGGFGHSGT
jgi:dUTP pyrophosphatase